MHRQAVSFLFLAGVFIAPLGKAEEIAIDIETDLEGDYFIVETTGTKNRPVVVVKQTSPLYTYYIKREFDCEAHQVRYLGEGESRADMAASEPASAPDMEDIRPGSIPDQLAGYVCPAPEPETDAEANSESPAH